MSLVFPALAGRFFTTWEAKNYLRGSQFFFFPKHFLKKIKSTFDYSLLVYRNTIDFYIFIVFIFHGCIV